MAADWSPDSVFKICRACNNILPLSSFDPAHPKHPNGIRENKCRCCLCPLTKRPSKRSRHLPYDVSDPRYILFKTSKISARVSKHTHTISPDDIPIPSTCQYLGVTLDYFSKGVKANDKADRATIDRINPAKGYIPGNIQVISRLANTMKSDAILDELITFAKGVLKVHAPQYLKK